ncbi:sterol carrier protein 2, partial [Tyrophagus putrescentiae]
PTSVKDQRRVFVIGVGMTPFTRPGLDLTIDYPNLVEVAVKGALADAHLQYGSVQFAAAGYVFGDSTCGQRSLYPLGMTGIPIVNVNNNCSTGSTALATAASALQTGRYDCVLAVGFEKMERGALGAKYRDRVAPMDRHVAVLSEMQAEGLAPAPLTAQLFAAAGREHMRLYGTEERHFAAVAAKNHRHAAANPNAQVAANRQKEADDLKEDEEGKAEDLEAAVLRSPPVFDFLTKMQCCPTSDGAAAVLLASEDFLRAHRHLEAQAVEILALEMVTDTEATFAEPRSAIRLIGGEMTALAAQAAYHRAAVTPAEVDLITYEALGLCPTGQAKALVERGDNTYGGKWVINPSGGLLGKGHPLGATGVAQCVELCWQLRGLAGRRQVTNARLALQHNIGLGGAAVVAIYRMMHSAQSTRRAPN